MRRLVWAGLVMAACGGEEPVVGAPLSDTGAERPVRATLEGNPLDVAPDDRTVRVSGPGVHWTLHLRRNDELFAPGYTVTVLGADGRLVELPAEQRPDHFACYYQGLVRDADGAEIGRAAVSTCFDGVRGALLVGGDLYDLDADAVGGRMERVELGATDVDGLGIPQDLLDRELPRAGAEPEAGDDAGTLRPPPAQRTVEVHTYADPSAVDAWGAAGAAARDAGKVNSADLLYQATAFTVPIRLSLVAQTALVERPFTYPLGATGGLDPIPFLDAWVAWSRAQSSPGDTSVLVTRERVEGATIGLSYVGSYCGSFRGQWIRETDSETYDAVLMAHELGHGMGMVHDGSQNGCASPGFVMAASSTFTATAPTSFSSCSVAEAEAWLSGKTCLDDAGDTLPAGPTCGNGIVESGEACDCGPLGCAAVDPCCVAATCQLTAGATCSARDACCDAGSCDVREAAEAHVCRDAQDATCDTPEVCDGASSACPTDVFASAGTACTYGTISGACFAGDCVSTGEQCDALDAVFTSMDPTASPQCDTLNTPCANLHCAQSPSTPSSCFFATLSSGPVQVDDGTLCGAGQQCLDGACVDSEELDLSLDDCPDDPLKTAPGACGCGTPDTNADGDGALDCQETCDDDPLKTAPDACGCGTPDVDVDPGPGLACPGCGNGFLEAAESCDGGSPADGDGCSSTCGVEGLTLGAPNPGTAGVRNTWLATGVVPGTPVYLIASLRSGTFSVPGCPGLTVPLKDPVLLTSATGDNAATATFRAKVPPIVAGRTGRMVAVDVASCRASPVVVHTF